MSISVAVTSGKGGTGKTSFTAAVGSCLAALGQKTLCIDMDIGLRNLDIALGMSDLAVMDFTDVIEGRCVFERATVEHPKIPGLYLLTAPFTLPLGLTDRHVAMLVARAKEDFDFVLVDSPAGLGDGFQLAAKAVDRAVVVSMTDPSALRDAQRTVMELSKGMETLHLVMNRVQPKLMRKLHTNIDQAMNAAGLPLLGVVPEDPKVTLAAAEGTPLVLAARKGAVVAYLNIAKRLMGRQVPLMMM